MGLFDKLKSAVNVVTGGAADVTIAWEPETVAPGEDLPVTVIVTSAGGEVKSDGVFVDVLGRRFIPPRLEPELEEADEEFVEDGGPDPNRDMELTEDEMEVETETVYDESVRLCDAFTLGAGEKKELAGVIALPEDLTPTSDSEMGFHYSLRGRLEAFGNDPDSGYKDLTVAAVDDA